MSAASIESVNNASSSAILLEVRELYCERDDRILFQHLNFQLNSGEVLQVQGSNGSGKTTLLRIICGINDNYSGTIYWQGREIIDQTEEFFSALLYLGHRVGVSKVPQSQAREHLEPRDGPARLLLSGAHRGRVRFERT